MIWPYLRSTSIPYSMCWRQSLKRKQGPTKESDALHSLWNLFSTDTFLYSFSKPYKRGLTVHTCTLVTPACTVLSCVIIHTCTASHIVSSLITIFIMVERKYILKHAIKSTTFCLTEFIMMPDNKPGVWAVPCKGLPHWVHNCWKKRDIMYISKLQRAANQASRAVKSLNYLIKRNCWAAMAGNDVLSQVFTPFFIHTLF